jgi:predicted MFS family arabinose efflux permease
MTVPRQERREWLVLLALSGVQFSQIVDFMVLMPLGTQLMRQFEITPTQLGFFVSIYTVTAGLSGFFSAFVVDRFDRKTVLLATFGCFAATMLACALAQSYPGLLAARAVAGAFGGVIAANIYTIVGDVVPEGRRGRAFGAVMSAFSLASIAGVPISLYLALHFTWRAPYLFLAGLCIAILLTSWFALPPVRAHIGAGREDGVVAQLRAVFGRPNHVRIFSFSALLIFSGFLLFPFIAPYLVANVGVSEAELPAVYLIAGLASLAAARFVGGLSDRVGRRRVFAAAAVSMALSALLMTSLPRSPLAVAVIVTMLMFSTSSARMVPAMALVTSGAEPQLRGSVMSFNSSIQQMAAGLASFVASVIIGRSAEGELTNYWAVGIVSAAGTLACIALARRIRSAEAAT